MARVLFFLDKLMRGILAAIVAVMSVTIFVQVLCRFIFGTAIIWAEEFAVLLFAWAIFLGAAYAQKDDSHLSINALRSILGPRTRVALDTFRLFVIAICSLVAIWSGIGLTERALPLLYPAMGISRSFLYVSVPVGFGLGLAFMVVDISCRVRNRRARKT